MATPLQPVSNWLQSCVQRVRPHLVGRVRNRRMHRKQACWLFLVFLTTLPVTAQDGSPPLAEIRVELEHLRAEAPQREATRGASPRRPGSPMESFFSPRSERATSRARS